MAVRPESRDELRQMLIDERRGVLWVPMNGEPITDERVLLDVRLPEAIDGALLRTRVSYTVPERHGPFFACRRDDVGQLHFLLDEQAGGARLHRRYPAMLSAHAVVGRHRLRCKVLDLSIIGVRLAVQEQLEPGTAVTLELDAAPPMLPPKLTARVIDGAMGGASLRLDGPDLQAWRRLRRMLRRAEETGLAPRMD